MRLERVINEGARWLAVLLGCLIFGTLWHEVVGHGVVGLLCGGRIESVEVLGMQLYPDVSWLGWQQHYGSCEVVDIPSATGEALMSLGGSASTWLVAVAALALLWARDWHGWWRWPLIALSLWWIDLVTYTLPSWGLKRSIVWGARYSEPYEAALALGIPGPLFQLIVVLSSMVLLILLIVRLRRPDVPPATK